MSAAVEHRVLGRPAGPVRLLIVDDSEDDAFLVCAELTRRGMAVHHRRVDCDFDMAAALAAEPWDVVLSDHNMPGFSSLAALDVLKSSGLDLPFIIHSGEISDRQAVSAMYEGVDDFIAKGDYDRLLPVIERELRGLHARRAVRQADERIRELVNFDVLSALPNHNLFCTKVGDWIADAGAQAAGAVLVVDVDRFMRINASFGYDTGNVILRQLGERLAAGLAADVMLARLGSDRFGVFLPGVVEREQAEIAARWLLRAFEQPFMKNDIELFLTASVGIAMVGGDGADVFELLMNAEAAVARVKCQGGNGVRCYDRAMNAASAERLTLEAELRHAVERGELRLFYQPIVDPDGTVRAAEALVRWQHPEQGLLAPDRFIPLADETGLITEIGAWVLTEACYQGRCWHDAGHERFRVSVNVSAVQFGQPRLLETVREALRGSGFPPACLTLEITESSLMSDVESAAGMLRSLKNMGVRIAVDDFGTGYSSLSYLRRLPIDTVKIDKSFVRDVSNNGEDAAIVRAIIALAHSLGLGTVAEGVETAEQEATLRREGCDSFQGYRYGRPVPAEVFVMGTVPG
ncbi:putative bifunctional diguanylate cyclase/phosphodiesterase [Azoarcus olearius]|uniref:EAL/GGDEF-domain containing signaling protein n=1 Tax=Azoarcus sp. (strain BH72) TaxID=418699 RepID=A1K5F7_AZOSB|nr:GGDEF domain-containing response regulator [Azoarcus olearius]CAL94062.1 EAL/GGDEF-domain containing signaling protein [Azoarcus olearius]